MFHSQINTLTINNQNLIKNITYLDTFLLNSFNKF